VPQPLGVGIIGAGTATQAIHLPVLAGLQERLRVRHVVAPDARMAAQIAGRADARSGTSVEALLDDPAVDIVAVCSPDRFHAAQVISACAAGKRGILVEKPLALERDEARAIADASSRYGVPLVVGTMQGWDPAWRAASGEWLTAKRGPVLVRSTIHLPDNERIMRRATDVTRRDERRLSAGVVSRLGAARRAVRPPNLMAQQARLRSLVMGFAVHAIPSIRVLTADLGEVTFARPLYPWGYAIAYDTAAAAVTMTASIGGGWAPTWSLDAWAAQQLLHVEFPPAFVAAGSAVATFEGPAGAATWRLPDNGYVAQWRHLADVAEGRAELAIPVATAVADVLHAIDLADAGAERLRLDASGSE
jgi:predicted dehydrogenase